MQHIPVMLSEVVSALRVGPGKIFLDGTVGYGGHAAELLRRSAPDGLLIGLDRDPDALAAARDKLAGYGSRCLLRQRNYREFDDVLNSEQTNQVDGMLLDLGVSSAQLTGGARGFSIQSEGPLDMRMDPENEISAADIVNQWPAQELADLFYHLADERFSRRYARAIVEARQKQAITTTRQLADLIAAHCPRRLRHLHPATRVFQALRIAVNDELGALDEFLDKYTAYLKPAGRIAILSYHSLEDRRVKHAFREAQRSGLMEIITKKPLTPSESETAKNPRARSAKLRVAERKEMT